MSTTVKKYGLIPGADKTSVVELPRSGTILCVQLSIVQESSTLVMAGGGGATHAPCLFVEGDHEGPTESRRFHIVGLDRPIDDLGPRRYHGTTQMQVQSPRGVQLFVLHVFERLCPTCYDYVLADGTCSKDATHGLAPFTQG